jgi:hypothetical protein
VAFISAELRGIGTFVAKVAGMPAKVQNAALKAMGVVGRELEKHVKTQHLSGQSLDPRTGNLRRAVFHAVGMLSTAEAFAKVGVDIKKAPYARVHELGGTIRPTKSKHLTIPLGNAKTAKGVGRFTARQLIERPESFGYVGTFTHNKIIFGKRDDGGIEPLFKLADSVTIKAVGYLTKTVEEKKAWVHKTINDFVREAFQKSLE